MYKKNKLSFSKIICIKTIEFFMWMFGSDIEKTIIKFSILLSIVGTVCYFGYSYVNVSIETIMLYGQYIINIVYCMCCVMFGYIVYYNKYNKKYIKKKYHDGIRQGNIQGFIVGNFSGYGIGKLENIIRAKYFS